MKTLKGILLAAGYDAFFANDLEQANENAMFYETVAENPAAEIIGEAFISYVIEQPGGRQDAINEIQENIIKLQKAITYLQNENN